MPRRCRQANLANERRLNPEKYFWVREAPLGFAAAANFIQAFVVAIEIRRTAKLQHQKLAFYVKDLIWSSARPLPYYLSLREGSIVDADYEVQYCTVLHRHARHRCML